MHVFRPLFVIAAFVAMILVARVFFMPDDFGVHESGYMYGWYRLSNVDEWKNVAVKYRGHEYCAGCHKGQTQKLTGSAHENIQCENCHGPARQHPADPLKLTLDRSRDLCLRCHTTLAYPTSERSRIKGIDPVRHNPGLNCVLCHKPHEASKPGRSER